MKQLQLQNNFISRHLFIFLFLLIVTYFLSSCAKQASPTGGDKDTIPPVPIFYEPENFTTNFDENKIKIKFNEYVQLKDIRSELIVSPPFEETPETKIIGKSVVIEFMEELKDSMTYNFNFGNSIVDYHESNPIKDFQYILSTGSEIDSFAVSGTILSSFNLTPPEDPILIFLYKNLHDSVPKTTLPFYIGKSRSKGQFMINNIQPGEYKVFALKDMNNNLLFDLPGEKIAFLDSTLILVPEEFEDHMNHNHDTLSADTVKQSIISVIGGDSNMVDSTDFVIIGDSIMMDTSMAKIVNDTINTDSVSTPDVFNLYGIETDLYFFEEDVPALYLDDYSRDDKRKLIIYFSESHTDTIILEPLNFDQKDWYIQERNPGNDTILYWITDTSLVNKDSLIIAANYTYTDTNQNYVPRTDTLSFIIKTEKKSQRIRLRGNNNDEETETKVEMLDISTNISGIFELNHRIRINSAHPLNIIDTSNIQLNKFENDSVTIPQKFRFYKDTNRYRSYLIDYKWEAERKYSFSIDSASIYDIYGLANDSLGKTFNTRGIDYYATVVLDLQGVDVPVILQLLKEEKVIREFYVESNKKATFDYLKPETYKIKAIYDANGDREWTTGDYDLKRQPEKVRYFEKEIAAKSNWVIEEIWELE